MSQEELSWHKCYSQTQSDFYQNAREAVKKGLASFNQQHLQVRLLEERLEVEARPLEIFLFSQDPASAVVKGGLIAFTQWGWLHLQTIWLAAELRGRGCGTTLMQLAHSEALARGCNHSRLATYSFQARGFYEKLGYEVYGQLEDYPPGARSYFMQKRLQDGGLRSQDS